MAGELIALAKQDGSIAPPKETGDADELFMRLKRLYLYDVEKARVWREEALEDFRFRDGYQWTAGELEHLREQLRPAITFNRIGVLVDAVVGSEIGNRREVRFIPREMADAKPSEILTSAAEWFRDDCDAEDEESEAFKDAVTAGMGWTETRLDYSDNPDGDPKIERIDAFEMVWDRHATKSNIADAKQVHRARRITIADARALFPEAEEDELNAAWAEFETDEDSPEFDRRNRYDSDSPRELANDSREVTIVETQYYETETYYKAAIMQPGMPEPTVEDNLPEERMDALRKAGLVMQEAKMTRRVVMRCFLGASTVLEPPKPTQTGTFTYNCVTGLKDNDKGTFYGVVRRVKDPQRWANKWLSQMMHIMNSQAKGGIMAEEGAFQDIREAERNWAKPDSLVIMNNGALSGNKWAPKPVAQFPAGFAQLMAIADENIVKASGINMELLGMRDANQPGVLEYQRKQSGIAILASFFDALRRYRKMQGRGMLHLIQNYLSDGRLIRIVGEERASYVPLTKESVADADYDIVVDDSPSSTNEKEKTWQLLQGILPMLKDYIGPEQALLLAEYSPLPTSMVEKIKASVQKAQQDAETKPDPAKQMAEMQMQLEQMKLQNEAEKIMADREKTAADREIAMINAETERMRLQSENFRAAAQPTVPQTIQ